MVEGLTGNLEVVACIAFGQFTLKILFQKSDGSFSEPGRVIHSDMQGLSSKGVALTAYVTIAFAQDEVGSVECEAFPFLLKSDFICRRTLGNTLTSFRKL